MSNIGGNANFRGSIRKGAWTGEEDDLLRKCIQKHGEGHWHRVPQRAGLNRCRKSCRLRWFNYLKPNIKRGQFNEDEVDLIIRLHNLLGNKWSLIAGRIPGRTANDVKNYWNTHLQKKLSPLPLPPKHPNTPPLSSCPKSNNIIRPQPSVLLPKISLPSLINKPDPLSSLLCGSIGLDNAPSEISLVCDHLVEDNINGNAKWWENLFEIEKGDQNNEKPCSVVNHVQEVNNVWEEDNHLWNFDVNMWE